MEVPFQGLEGTKAGCRASLMSSPCPFGRVQSLNAHAPTKGVGPGTKPVSKPKPIEAGISSKSHDLGRAKVCPGRCKRLSTALEGAGSPIH